MDGQYTHLEDNKMKGKIYLSLIILYNLETLQRAKYRRNKVF